MTGLRLRVTNLRSIWRPPTGQPYTLSTGLLVPTGVTVTNVGIRVGGAEIFETTATDQATWAVPYGAKSERGAGRRGDQPAIELRSGRSKVARAPAPRAPGTSPFNRRKQ